MQKRYIDHTDFDHLVNTLSQDYKPLNNRIKKIEQVVQHTFGTIKNRKDSNHVTWKSPVSGNIWSIYYIYSSYRKKIDVDFYPFTEFSSSRGEKEFLLLSKFEKLKVVGSKLITAGKIIESEDQNTFKDYLVKNSLFLIIFRGHFIDRFRMRADKKEYTPFEIIMQFTINPDLVLVDNFQQKHGWLMYLHSDGVAMIRLENNYIVFDTFIAKHELKESQVTAIKNYLNSLNNLTYGAVLFLLLDTDEWLDIVDKDRLLNWMLILASRDPVNLKNLMENSLPNLIKLYGESFLDMFQSVDKPGE